MCWYIDFYAPDEQGKYTKPTALLGSLRPQSNKAYSSNYYCVRLARPSDQDIKIYYIRLEGGFPKTNVFAVGTLGALDSDLKSNDYTIMMFAGIIIAVLFSTLFLYFSTRDRVYIIYAVYLLAILIVTSFVSGYPFFYHPWLWKYYFVFMSFLIFTSTLFTVSYLELYEKGRYLYRWLWLLTITLGFIFPFNKGGF